MKAYLDNNIVSSIVKDDNASQSAALSTLLEAYDQGKVSLVTSEVTLEEIRKCPEKHRVPLERTFRLLEKVPVAASESLLFITHTYGAYGTSSNSPIFQTDPLFQSLLALGLEQVDVRHIFSAAKESCTLFLTCDNSRGTSILRRAAGISALCGVQVQRPSEFVASQRW